MALLSSVVLGISLTAAATAGNDPGVAATCCAPAAPVCCVDQQICCHEKKHCALKKCCSLFACSSCGDCECISPKCWAKLMRHSTGDMYQHHAYFPECHGYYYFRPYNWVHIDQHRSAFPTSDMKYPYSNAVFDDIAHRFELAGHSVGVADSDVIRARNSRLPGMEAILSEKK